MPAIKLIDQQGEFQRNPDAEIKRWSLSDGHKVVTAFGSTLNVKTAFLNLVFGTDFQNTDGNEGISICIYEANISLKAGTCAGYSMVRKCALLSIIFSDVFTFHITTYWLAMRFIKPIFEVAIGLFSKMTPRVINQTLLLFVVTQTHSDLPGSRVQHVLIADLERLWAEQTKPPELADHRLYDYFDVSFIVAPYLSLSEWAKADVSKPKARFLDKDRIDYVFQPRYQKKIAIDKLGLCMERLWLQLNTEYVNIDFSVFVIEN
ncbi:root hair defective 3 GTP-binding protein-domain-containing protein [Amanita rubescens]|nr:root hair defective 3 GTP-binding protein-domain-containing protein [Amanita rubescens]KAF8333664.1 root hair defective 3 GTP-binding protein-domain-containing protein [Amanita rubescens]